MATSSTIALKGRKVRKEPVAYSEFAMRNNAAILDYCRTSMSALSGATAGIIGLTSFYGFAFYFITALVLSLMLLLKAGSQWNRFFISRPQLIISGLMGGLFTYVLFWTGPCWYLTCLLVDVHVAGIALRYEHHAEYRLQLQGKEGFPRNARKFWLMFLYGMVHVL